MGWRSALNWWALGEEDPLDSYQATNQFVAVALTDGYTLTQLQANSLMPAATFVERYGAADPTQPRAPQRIERVAFRGRILDGVVPSPHSYLSDPCSLDKTTSPAYTTGLILQHTEFILTEDYFNSTLKQTININDRVNVYLKPGTNDTPFDLERGWCVGVNRTGKLIKKKGDKTLDCTTLQEIMEGANVTTPAPTPQQRPIPTAVVPVDPDAEECVELDSQAIAYPCRKNMDVTLIVFYHGTGQTQSATGEWIEKGPAEAQQDVLNAVKKTGIPDNVMFLIPRGHGASYADVEGAIAELEKLDNNITIDEKKMRLGAWSAGSSGFSKAYNRSPPWDQLMLADPSPSSLVHLDFGLSVVYMEYNPANWRGDFEGLGPQLETIVAPAINASAGSANNYGANHQKILEEILKKIAQ